MLTSKQRSALRAMANELEPVLQVGKGDIGENLIKQLEGVLEKRELIKVTVLKNCGRTPREVCDELAAKTGADPVQTIGNRFVLYRRSTENPQIEI